MNHPYAFHFKKSAHSKMFHSGPDYSKIVIIKNTIFLDNKAAIFPQRVIHIISKIKI